MVDQATACHTAGVVMDTECAQGVRQAFAESCKFLGRCPQVLVHDNKPIYDEQGLKAPIEPTTRMLPASPARPENKAVVKGEFGKFEQEAVGSLHLDDSSLEHLKRSAVSEVIRAYSDGINHAGRADLDPDFCNNAAFCSYSVPRGVRTRIFRSLITVNPPAIRVSMAGHTWASLSSRSAILGLCSRTKAISVKEHTILLVFSSVFCVAITVT